MKRPDGVTLGLLAVSAVAAALLIVGTAPHGSDAPDTAPDWTVATCADWEGHTNAEMPPYTLTDRCVDTDGTVLYTTDEENRP